MFRIIRIICSKLAGDLDRPAYFVSISMLCIGDLYDGDSGEIANLATADAIAVSKPDHANRIAADGARSTASNIWSSNEIKMGLDAINTIV